MVIDIFSVPAIAAEKERVFLRAETTINERQ